MQSQITNIEPRGSWESQYGTMHSFFVTFADGQNGEANSKQQTPPYNIGDTVEYEIKSSNEYGNKLKISKPGFNGNGNGGSGGNYNGGGGKKSFDSTGPRVGAAMNKAIDMLIAGTITKDRVEATALWIAQTMERVEAKLKAPAQPVQQPAPQPQPQPAPTPPASECGQYEGATIPAYAGPTDDDDDIPF